MGSCDWVNRREAGGWGWGVSCENVSSSPPAPRPRPCAILILLHFSLIETCRRNPSSIDLFSQILKLRFWVVKQLGHTKLVRTRTWIWNQNWLKKPKFFVLKPSPSLSFFLLLPQQIHMYLLYLSVCTLPALATCAWPFLLWNKNQVHQRRFWKLTVYSTPKAVHRLHCNLFQWLTLCPLRILVRRRAEASSNPLTAT